MQHKHQGGAPAPDELSTAGSPADSAMQVVGCTSPSRSACAVLFVALHATNIWQWAWPTSALGLF
jgi:hypothetical protein